VRAIDGADREGTYKELDFTYLPNAEPEAELTSPSRVEVTAGNAADVEVMAENTGELGIDSLEISASGAASGSESISEFMPDDTENVSFEIDTSSDGIGKKSISFSSNYSNTANTELRIVANEEQKTRLEEDLSSYESSLESLKSNLSSLRSKASQKVTSPVSSNVSSVEDRILSARTEIESGKYYKAEETLNGIDSSIQSARASYRSAEQTYRSNQRNMMILAAAGIIGVIGLGSGAFLYRSDRVDLGIKGGSQEDQEINHSGKDQEDEDSESLIDRIKKMFESSSGGGKDAEDFEWNGFN
jgi:hypothetical protein